MISDELIPASQPARVRAAASRVQLLAGVVIGNALETFDFVVYGILAVVLGAVFFPEQAESARVLLSLSVFGAGYLLRPLGAVVLGVMADRLGRKKVLTLTLLLMAIGTGMIAILPTFAQIGLFAPVLMVVARLIQGFSAGGEMAIATTYLVESAPPSRRGVFGSFQIVSQSLAYAVGGLVGSLLSRYLSDSAFHTWGWRLPFLFGVFILPIGIVIRRRFDETLDSSERYTSTGALLQDLSGKSFWTVARCLVLCIPGTVTVFVGIYMTTYAITVLHLPMYVAFSSGLIGGVVAMFSAPLGGALSDVFGRKPVILFGRILLILAVWPAFRLLNIAPSSTTLCAVVGFMLLCNALSGSAELVFVPESIPARLRSTGFSIAYSVSAAVFGGCTPVLLAWLVGRTGDSMMPAWLLMIVTAIGLLPLSFMRETVSRRK
jgi:MFS family permease